jgi:hypothetical protein
LDKLKVASLTHLTYELIDAQVQSDESSDDAVNRTHRLLMGMDGDLLLQVEVFTGLTSETQLDRNQLNNDQYLTTSSCCLE